MLKKLAWVAGCAALFALGFFVHLAGGLLGGGSGAGSASRSGGPPGRWPGRLAAQPTSRPSAEMVPVEVAPVLQSTIRERVSGSGLLEAERQVTIVARVEGEVESLAVEEGDSVQEGQELCGIEEEALQIAQVIARIERDQAAAEHQRMQDLLTRKAASPKEVDDARFAMERAKAAFDEALLRRSYSRPRAPFTSIVVRRSVEKGQHVRPGDALFVIADFDPLLLRIHLPEREVASVAVGQAVELRPERAAPVTTVGKVERISPVVDRESLTVEVTTTFEDVPSRLRPGSFGRVDILTRTLKDVILVPRAALLREDGITHLFRVVEGNRVQRVNVGTGYEDEAVVQIHEGLSPGDLVVVSGHRDLQDGALIRVYREVPIPIDPLSVEGKPSSVDKPKQK
ncbi:MAG: efflux RND transporter periplasmic adaptor subunit [Planctomycetota bacterium]